MPSTQRVLIQLELAQAPLKLYTSSADTCRSGLIKPPTHCFLPIVIGPFCLVDILLREGGLFGVQRNSAGFQKFINPKDSQVLAEVKEVTTEEKHGMKPA